MEANFVGVITDCNDEAMVAMTARLASWLDCTAIPPIGVEGEHQDLQASHHLVRMLDATCGRPGVFLVNAAPRDAAEQAGYENGAPFGYFFYGKTLVVSTMHGRTLSLVKKLGIATTIRVVSIADVLKVAVEHGELNAETALRVENTQFRGFEFGPRLVEWLTRDCDTGESIDWEVPSIEQDLSPTLVGFAACYIDNFGNVKTNILPEQFDLKAGDTIQTAVRAKPIQYRHYFHDVKIGETAFVTGSHGINEQRLLELVIRKGRAADKYNVKVGDPIFPQGEQEL